MKEKILTKIEANMSQTTVDRYRAEFTFNKSTVSDTDIKKLMVYGEITPEMTNLGYSVTLSPDRLKAFLSFEENAECFNL